MTITRFWWDEQGQFRSETIPEWEFYMTDSLSVTDQLSEAVRVAPRITKEFIESQIDFCAFETGDGFIAGATLGGLEPTPNPWHEDLQVPMDDAFQEQFAHHTICILRTRGGFTVIGHSAPASPANFNAELGRQFAYENAFRQLWPLFAFALLEFGKVNATYPGVE